MRGQWFWGVVIVILGVLLLLNSLGVIQVDVWSLMWPFVLILFGVWMLWGALRGGGGLEREEISIPLEEAQSARVRLQFGAGRVRADSSAAPGELMSGSFSGGVAQKVSRTGTAVDATLSVPSSAFGLVWAPWIWGPRGGLEWVFGLSKEVPLALDVEVGAADVRLDLSELQVTDLKVETGASATEVTLPAGSEMTRAKISCGAASVNVRVPAGVAARIQYTGGLSGFSIDRSRFPRVGAGRYESPDYGTAANRVELHVEAGVGSVNVR
jgi:hypothetical protein